MESVIDEVVEETYKELYLKALDKIDELEKALDKLCKFIIENANEDCYNGCPYKIKNYWTFGNSVEDLKEWALKDE